jgi:hypothetical protein
VHLALTIMEARLENAYKDLNAKKAEVTFLSPDTFYTFGQPEGAVHWPKPVHLPASICQP